MTLLVTITVIIVLTIAAMVKGPYNVITDYVITLGFTDLMRTTDAVSKLKK